jgi:hypothetical protein
MKMLLLIEKMDDSRPRLDILNVETLFDQNIFIHELSAIRSIAFNRYY